MGLGVEMGGFRGGGGGLGVEMGGFRCGDW